MRSICTLSAQKANALYASMATVLRRPPIEQDRLLDAIEQLAAQQYGGVVERRFVTALGTGRPTRVWLDEGANGPTVRNVTSG